MSQIPPPLRSSSLSFPSLDSPIPIASTSPVSITSSSSHSTILPSTSTGDTYPFPLSNHHPISSSSSSSPSTQKNKTKNTNANFNTTNTSHVSPVDLLDNLPPSSSLSSLYHPPPHAPSSSSPSSHPPSRAFYTSTSSFPSHPNNKHFNDFIIEAPIEDYVQGEENHHHHASSHTHSQRAQVDKYQKDNHTDDSSIPTFGRQGSAKNTTNKPRSNSDKIINNPNDNNIIDVNDNPKSKGVWMSRFHFGNKEKIHSKEKEKNKVNGKNVSFEPQIPISSSLLSSSPVMGKINKNPHSRICIFDDDEDIKDKDNDQKFDNNSINATINKNMELNSKTVGSTASSSFKHFLSSLSKAKSQTQTPNANPPKSSRDDLDIPSLLSSNLNLYSLPPPHITIPPISFHSSSRSSSSTPSPTFITQFSSDLLDELNRNPKWNVEAERRRLRIREIDDQHHWKVDGDKNYSENLEPNGSDNPQEKSKKPKSSLSFHLKRKSSAPLPTPSPTSPLHPLTPLPQWNRQSTYDPIRELQRELQKDREEEMKETREMSEKKREKDIKKEKERKMMETKEKEKSNEDDDERKSSDSHHLISRNNTSSSSSSLFPPSSPSTPNPFESSDPIPPPLSSAEDISIDIPPSSPSSHSSNLDNDNDNIPSTTSPSSSPSDVDDIDPSWSLRLTQHDHPIYGKFASTAKEIGKIRREKEKEKEEKSLIGRVKYQWNNTIEKMRNRFQKMTKTKTNTSPSSLSSSSPSLSSSLSSPSSSHPSLTELRDVARELRYQALSSYDFDRLLRDGESLDAHEAKELYLMMMTKALFGCGLPMHAVEFYIILSGQKMGIHCSVMSIMTSCVIAFGPKNVAHLIQPTSPSLSLSKMCDITVIAESIIREEGVHRASLEEIQRVVLRPSCYPSWMFLPAMTAVSFFGAPLFNGGWIECFIGGLGGLFTGIIELYYSDNKSVSRGHDLLSGLFVSVISNIIYIYVAQINLLAACFAGIFWSLPGLRCVLAVNDLSNGNPVTGTAKFMSTMMTIMNLAIGILVGLQIQLTQGDTINLFIQSTSVFPIWVPYLCVLFCCPAMMVLLDASPSHWFPLSLGAMAAYTCSSISATYVGSTFGTWLSSFLVGIMSNSYGRKTANPAIEMYLFSILMLVPGSIGVKSILANSALSSVEFFIQMIAVAIAIVTGLFTSNLILPPLRAI